MVQDKKSKYISVTPTVDTSAYTSGDRLGSLMTLTDIADATGDTIVIKSIVITDKASQSKACDILFFDASPTIASADNAALDISDTEMVSKCIGRIVFLDADYTGLAANSLAAKNGIECELKAAAGSRDLYCLLQARGAPTYSSTSDLTLKFLVEQY